MNTLKKILLFSCLGILFYFLFFVFVVFYSFINQFVYHKITIPSWNKELEQLIPKYKICILSGTHSNIDGYYAKFHIFIPNIEARKEFIHNIIKAGEDYVFHVDIINKHTHYLYYKNGYGVSIEDRGNGTFCVEFDEFTHAQFDYIRKSKYSK